MFLSKERQASLSKKLIDELTSDKAVKWDERPDSARRTIVRILAACEQADEQVRRQAEASVTQLKRNVPEGSGEWEILVRKHLNSEFDRLERYRIDYSKI